MSKARPHSETHQVIICVDCGKQREIRNQDLHEVVRCVECQKEYRRITRNCKRNKEINNG